MAGVAQLLSAALSSDNNVRRNAEQQLGQHLRSNPEKLLTAVLVQLCKGETPQVRQLSAVFLRKKLTIGEPMLFHKLSGNAQQTFKTALLRAITTERTRIVQSNICDTVAELGRYLLARNQWPQLMPFLFASARRSEEALRAVAFTLFEKIADAGNPDTFGDNLNPVVTEFNRGLRDGSPRVKLAALGASAALIGSFFGDDKVGVCQPLLDPILSIVHALASTKNEMALEKAVQHLSTIATDSPHFYRPRMAALARVVMGLGGDREYDAGFRNACLEVLVAVTEGADAMVRKSQEFCAATVQLSVRFLVEVYDDPQWGAKTQRESQGQEENSLFEYAETALDRIALAIHGKRLSPVLFPLVQKLIVQQDWKMRHAALTSLSQCAEVLELKQLPVGRIVGFMRDPHPRVRYMAINCVGQISADFYPDVQKSYHSVIIPPLLANLAGARHPRIQIHAAAALFNFVEPCISEDEGGDPEAVRVISGYVDKLVSELVKVLRSGPVKVKQQILTTLACLAGSSKERFAKHYDGVMTMVMNLLANANGKQLETLRARAMECATFIGLAVGAERFRPQAVKLINLFIRMMKQGFGADDTTKQYVFQAWNRIASAMKQEFAPYLPYVMPALLREAERKVEFQSSRLDGRLMMGLTSSLEDKATVCSMINSFASDVNTGFLPFVKRTAEVMLPLASFYLSDEVRAFAVNTMPDLIRCTVRAVKAQQTDPQFLLGLFRKVTEELVTCLKLEPDVDILMTIVQGLQRCLLEAKELARRCLDQKALQVVGKALLHSLEQSAKRLTKLEKKLSAPDVDDVAVQKIKQAQENEDELSLMAADLIGTLTKTHGDAFLPVFRVLAPDVVKMLHPSRTAKTRQYGIFIVDDLVEYLGPKTDPFIPHVVPSLLRYSLDPSPEIMQGAVYGLGVCAERAGPAFNQFVKNTARVLAQVISQNRQKNQEALYTCTDNAISAFAKLCRCRSQCLDLGKMLPTWLRWLPLRADRAEAPGVYGMLCKLVEANDARLLGDKMANLPKIVGVLTSVYDTEMANQEVSQRIQRILRQVAKNQAVVKGLKGMFPSPLFAKLGSIVRGGA